jgi:hypothetical protein
MEYAELGNFGTMQKVNVRIAQEDIGLLVEANWNASIFVPPACMREITWSVCGVLTITGLQSLQMFAIPAAQAEFLLIIRQHVAIARKGGIGYWTKKSARHVNLEHTIR